MPRLCRTALPESSVWRGNLGRQNRVRPMRPDPPIERGRRIPSRGRAGWAKAVQPPPADRPTRGALRPEESKGRRAPYRSLHGELRISATCRSLVRMRGDVRSSSITGKRAQRARLSPLGTLLVARVHDVSPRDWGAALSGRWGKVAKAERCMIVSRSPRTISLRSKNVACTSLESASGFPKSGSCAP